MNQFIGYQQIYTNIPKFVILAFLTAIMVCFVSRGYALEQNIDRWGSDYKHFPLSSPNPKLCEKKCRTDIGMKCKAFTYVKQSNMCFLKNKIPLPKEKSCCISGVVRQNICTHGNNGQLQDKSVDASSYGWGITYDVAGTGSWIQYSIPTKEADTVVESIFLRFTIKNPKYGWISAVHFWDGGKVLQKFDDQMYGSSLSSEKSKTVELLLPLSKPFRVKNGIGISILPKTKVGGLKKIVNIQIHSVCASILTSPL